MSVEYCQECKDLIFRKQITPVEMNASITTKYLSNNIDLTVLSCMSCRDLLINGYAGNSNIKPEGDWFRDIWLIGSDGSQLWSDNNQPARSTFLVNIHKSTVKVCFIR